MENQDFKAKPVEQPILEPGLRQEIRDEVSVPDADESFYQANKYYIWAIVFGALVIAVLAFFAFKKPSSEPVKQANLAIYIDSPDTVPSGGEAVYTIKVENQDTKTLSKLSLELVYPDGMSYVFSNPKAENLSGSLFDVPDLSPKQNVTIFVKTKVVGNINEVKTLKARLHYSFSNFNSEFVADKSADIRLSASDVAVEITGPKETTAGQLVIYEIRYKNNAKEAIKNARVKAEYPADFSFGQADPAPSLSNNIWSLPALEAGGEGIVKLTGTYKSAGPGEQKTINVNFEVLGPDGNYFTQANSTAVSGISSLPLVATQEIQSAEAFGIVSPGDSVNVIVKYQNNSNIAVSGVNILVTLNSKSIDFSSLSAEGGQVTGNTILWNAAGVSNLERLNPSESGILSLNFKVKDPAVSDSTKNLQIDSSIKIKSNEYEAFFPGNSLSLKISSPAQLKASLEYLSGSLPPKPGQQTVYKVKFILQNSSNDFSAGTVSAFLPLGPSGFVAGSVKGAEAANTQFDQSTGKLSWNVGFLPAYTGKYSPSKILEFQIKLSPSASQVGQTPDLVKNIVFSGKDNFTAQDIILKTDDLNTSNLPGDQGYENGRVE